ncbi:acyltransferase family protein [Ornithinimicrobium kibberense]|uniref:Acyltransferase family protein n=1 Tax=Ornithinimicrobium kibberense TaxID=282060 RepID=A0ABV5V5S2_9MICO|nr:acyltransferase family protein [Ornithinimicrobium kibberense]
MTATALPPAGPATARARTKGPLRGDIEGLRAVAVLMVLAYHVGLPGSSGGFAGVDVFFVISGYLITSQLVREATQEGRVSIPRFYARRARRLLPAATVVLVSTTLAGLLVLPRGRQTELGTEVLAATGYVVNWLFASREVDYLAEDADPSWVQHYWSLSVEEQFYVVWPLLIILVLWLATKLRLRFLRLLTVVLAGLVAASLVWSVVHTADSPGTAYFSTLTRAWQLGAGALLVLLTPALARVRRPVAAGAAWGGLALVAATLVVVDGGTAWPGSAALLPTVGTAAVIAAGIAWADSPPARLLGVAPMRFLGGLSYGLYLWHWPALSLLAEVRPDASLPVRVVVALGSVVLAWLTLRLVEDPVRFSPLLARDQRRTLTLGAVAMATSGALALALVVTAPRLETTLDGADGAVALVDPASRASEELRMRSDPAAAVGPVDQLVPDPATVEEDLSLAYRDGCQVNVEGTEPTPVDECWYGDPDGDTTVALVGDSKAEQWSSALHAVALQEGWRLKAYTKSACAFVDEGRSESCHAYNRELSTHLGEPEHAPDIVVTSAGAGYDAEMVDSAVGLLRPALDAGAEVVVLADTSGQRPRGMGEDVTVYECLDVHRDDPAPCWSEPREAPGDKLLAPLAERLDASFVDLDPWICPDPDELGGCAPAVGGVIVNRQGSHLTGSYVRSLTPVLHHALVVAGVASTPLDQIGWAPAVDPQRR